MSKIEDLIKQYCPNGSEWKRLGDTSLFRISRGVVISKSYIAEHHGQYPVYSSQTENDGCLGCIDTYAVDGERITWTTDGAKAGTVFYRSGKYNITNVCGMIECVSSDISCKYVSYVFGVKAPKFVNKAMGNCKLMSNVVENIQIPVPPLSVQEEIVRILDEYTELENELEAKLSEEIELKQKQYEFYRDELLTFGDGVERKRLGDVADVISGYPFDSSQFKNHGVKLMRGVNVKRGTFNFNDSDDRYWETDDGLEQYYLQQLDIVISMDGSLVGKSFGFFDLDIPMLLVQRVARIRTYDMNSRFLWHWICTNFSVYVDSCKTKGAIPHISLKNIRDFIVPVPSITEQERIVKILDKYDTYTRDMISTLNTELEFRKKQYAYYRDQLLTFKRKEM